MNDASLPLDPDALSDDLFAETGWVRRLARSLVADPTRADDVAQEAWLAARRNPPERGRPVRPWLAQVVRNLARQAGRSEGRRRHREHASARPEAVPSPAELDERLEVSRRVTEAVAALREPYRSAILMRFHHGLEPLQIAEHLGVPASTVRARLSRAVAELRERLDREHGGERAAWSLVLVRWIRAEDAALATAGSTGALAGALTMTTLLKTTLAVSAALVGGLLVFVTDASEPLELPGSEAELTAADSAAPRVARRPAPESAGAGAGSTEAPTPGGPDALAGPIPATPVDPSPPAAPGSAVPFELRGVALDVAGRPWPDLEVGPDEDDARDVSVITDGEGSFSLPWPRPYVAFDVRTDGVVVFARKVPSERGGAQVLRVARAMPLVVRVTDAADGRPLTGAEVRIEVPPARMEGGSAPGDFGAMRSFAARSDEEGLARFAAVPELAEADVLTAMPGYVSGVRRLSERARAEHEIEVALERFHGTDDWIVNGIVHDERGRPVSDALIGHGNQSARSADDGRFRIRLDPSADTPLAAAKEGFQPWRASGEFGGTLGAIASRGGELKIVLRDAPLEICGRVKRADGKRLRSQGALFVFPADPTLLTWNPDSEEPPWLLGEWVAESAGSRSAPWGQVDSRGAFRLGGLADRPYELIVCDMLTLANARTGPVPAGTTDLEVELSTDTRRVQGRLTTLDGRRLGTRATVTARLRLPSFWEGWSDSKLPRRGASPIGDSGRDRYRLKRVPASGVELLVLAEDHEPKVVPVEDGGDVELDVALERLCEARVDLGQTSVPARAFTMLGADGTPRRLWLDDTMAWGVPIEALASPRFRVAESATELVLYDEGGESWRGPVSVVPGELTVLRP